MNPIAYALKRFREKKGVTQLELCKKTRGLVNISTIKRLESGQEINPTFKTLEALRQALEISPIDWYYSIFLSSHVQKIASTDLARQQEETSPLPLPSLFSAQCISGLQGNLPVGEQALVLCSHQHPQKNDLVLCVNDSGATEIKRFDPLTESSTEARWRIEAVFNP